MRAASFVATQHTAEGENYPAAGGRVIKQFTVLGGFSLCFAAQFLRSPAIILRFRIVLQLERHLVLSGGVQGDVSLALVHKSHRLGPQVTGILLGEVCNGGHQQSIRRVFVSSFPFGKTFT